MWFHVISFHDIKREFTDIPENPHSPKPQQHQEPNGFNQLHWNQIERNQT